MLVFRLRGVHQMFGGPIFDGRNEIFLLGKPLKFRVIFQKYALKLKTSINFEKNGKFSDIFNFRRGLWEK